MLILHLWSSTWKFFLGFISYLQTSLTYCLYYSSNKSGVKAKVLPLTFYKYYCKKLYSKSISPGELVEKASLNCLCKASITFNFALEACEVPLIREGITEPSKYLLSFQIYEWHSFWGPLTRREKLGERNE